MNTAEPTPRDASRTPRAQSARDKSKERDVKINLSLDDTGPVPQDIQPRDGYENMWIRVMEGSEPAYLNMSVADRQGWTPVDPKTLDRSYAYITAQNDRLGNVIGTHDLVLMERPIEYGDEVRQLLKNRVQEKVRATQGGVLNELSGTGMNLRDDSHASLDVGRRAEVAPD